MEPFVSLALPWAFSCPDWAQMGHVQLVGCFLLLGKLGQVDTATVLGVTGQSSQKKQPLKLPTCKFRPILY